MVAQILPFLSRLIPAGIAIKGIKNVSPQMNTFLQSSFAAGYGADQVLDFLRDKAQTTGAREENRKMRGDTSTMRPDERASLEERRQREIVPDLLQKGLSIGTGIAAGAGAARGMQGETEQNIIQQFSPSLDQFMQNQMSRGRSPTQAGALAQNNNNYQSVIRKIQSKTGLKWSDLINQTYGNQQESGMQPPQQEQQTPVNQMSNQDLMQDLQNLLST